MCIGMKVAYQELRLILSRLLWSFNLALKDPKDVFDWGEQSTYILWVSVSFWILDEVIAKG